MELSTFTKDGILKSLSIEGTEEELKKLAFHLMDAIDIESTSFLIGVAQVTVNCRDAVATQDDD